MSLSLTSMLTCSSYGGLSLIDTTLFRNGKAVIIDGHNLSVPALVATSRHNAQVLLNGSNEIRARIQASRDVITAKVETSKSVYGVSTGFGGSGKRLRFPLLLPPVTDSCPCPLQRTLARPTPWPWEARYCNTNMPAFSPRPQMYSLPSPFSTPWRPQACRSLGFAAQSSFVSTP